MTITEIFRFMLIGRASVLVQIIRLLILLYILLLIVTMGCSNRIIFPGRNTYQDGPGIFKINTDDGLKLSAARLVNPKAEYTILFIHGNAEDIGDLSEFLELFCRHGFSVMSYDYRGYGTSQGKPSEKNSYRDAEAVYDYLVDDLQTPPDRIIVLGRSIGGAMAVHLACHKPMAGVILESTLLSAYRTIMPIPLLPFDKFKNIDKIKNIHCPILIVHGTSDRIIPFSHGKKLFGLANQPKQHLWVSGAGHNDLLWVAKDQYWDAIENFLKILPKK